MRRGVDYAAYADMAKRVDASTLDTPSHDEVLDSEVLKPEIYGLYDRGYRRGVSTGFRSMDDFFTVRHGEFTVITGIPGHGKSSWLDNVMVNISHAENWVWAVFSAESFPVSRHIAGLSEIYLGKPFRPGPTQRMSKTELDFALGWLGQHFRFIRPKEDRYSLDRIVQIAFTIENLDALVIDPWNELDHSRPREMREDEFISTSLTKLRWFSRSAEIHIFVVAHPAKYIRQPDKPKPVITLNDVKGASEWYAKADNGISVWRDELDETGATDVHIQKIRFREVGRAGGAVRLKYDRITGRFTDPMHKPTIDELVARQATPRPEASWFGRQPGEDDE